MRGRLNDTFTRILLAEGADGYFKYDYRKYSVLIHNRV